MTESAENWEWCDFMLDLKLCFEACHDNRVDGQHEKYEVEDWKIGFDCRFGHDVPARIRVARMYRNNIQVMTNMIVK